MKLYEATALAIRILGIYLLLDAISFAVDLYGQREQFIAMRELDFLDILIPLFFSSIGFFTLTGLICIKFPVSIAKYVVPTSSVNQPTINLNSNDFSNLAITILGLYILSWAIPDVIYNALMIIKGNYFNSSNAEIYEFVINEAATMIELSIGLYLTLSSAGVNILISRFRGRAL